MREGREGEWGWWRDGDIWKEASGGSRERMERHSAAGYGGERNGGRDSSGLGKVEEEHWETRDEADYKSRRKTLKINCEKDEDKLF